jgi:pyruvate/2-oxoglutarate dehydrogenase complex dihydrolipoamide acyltransferase (E2) component
MRHALICVSLALTAVAIEGRSVVQAQNYAWCAVYKGGSGSSCGFRTFEQCLASVSGVGGTCNANPAAGRGAAPPEGGRSWSREEQRGKQEQRAKAREEQQKARAREEQKSKQAAPPPAKPAPTAAEPAKPATPPAPPVAATPAPAAGSSARKSAPSDARVYFVDLKNGAEIPSKVTLLFGVEKMGVAPAGIDNPNTGHHHLLIDSNLPALDQPIPSDFNHLHFGAGQTEATITLSPGKHTLQLLFADTDHVPHNPPVMSQPITVTVKK